MPNVLWTFNPADASITCAAALIAVLALRGVRLDGTSARTLADRRPPLAADRGAPPTGSDGLPRDRRS
jgi:hypothetical protein